MIKRVWFDLASSTLFSITMLIILLAALFFVGDAWIWKGISLFLILSLNFVNFNYRHRDVLTMIESAETRKHIQRSLNERPKLQDQPDENDGNVLDKA